MLRLVHQTANIIDTHNDENDELHNFSKNRSAQNDVATENPMIAKELSDKIMSWADEVSANVPKPDAKFDEDLAQMRHKKLEMNVA